MPPQQTPDQPNSQPRVHPAPALPERPLSALRGTRGQPGRSRRQAPGGGGGGGGPGADGGPQRSPPRSQHRTCSRGPSHAESCSESHLGASGSLSGIGAVGEAGTQQREAGLDQPVLPASRGGLWAKSLPGQLPTSSAAPRRGPPSPRCQPSAGQWAQGLCRKASLQLLPQPHPGWAPMAESSHGSPGRPLGSAGPLRCSPSPGAAGRALLEAPPPRSGQDRGSRSGPATPALPQAGPRSTQHGVPSARLPGPRAHGLFHGWRSGRWGRALPRGWRASGHRTWPGTGAEQAESGPSPHPAPAGRAGSAGSLRQLLFHPPATPLHRPSRLQAPPPSGPGNCPHGSWPSPGRPLPTQPASADPQAAATPGRPPRPAWNQIQNLETREGPSCPCPAPAPAPASL